MKIKELLQRNYQSTVDRGLIFPSTNGFAFVEKMKEEVSELEQALNEIKRTNTISDKYYNEMKLELADVIMVGLNMARHFNIDIFKEIEKKIIINEERANERN